MKKLPCLFQRDFTDKRNPKLLPVVTPGCEWVLEGEGVPTLKLDGTACMVKDGKLYKRYDAKRGKTPPVGAIPCTPEPDDVTGHWPHWVLVGDEPESKYHREAYAAEGPLPDGTYELCGPKFNGNPEDLLVNTFIRHGSIELPFGGYDRTFEGIGEYLRGLRGEGIVFHHPDGRMCKIRRDDYGYEWPIAKK